MAESIRLEGVRKAYQNGAETLEIFDHLDLSLPDPCIAVITGESGSGKSTLLHLLGGMDRPSEGKVLVAGKSLSSSTESQLAEFRQRSVGFIFQFHHLLRDFTALENVMMPALILGSDADSARKRAAELLERVGVGHRSGAFPGELSGGERQRTAVARAVMNDPAVILADEPTGSLDELHSQEVEELLFGLCRDLAKTLILVTHNQRLADHADLHLHLSKGSVEIVGGAAR